MLEAVSIDTAVFRELQNLQRPYATGASLGVAKAGAAIGTGSPLHGLQRTLRPPSAPLGGVTPSRRPGTAGSGGSRPSAAETPRSPRPASAREACVKASEHRPPRPETAPREDTLRRATLQRSLNLSGRGRRGVGELEGLLGFDCGSNARNILAMCLTNGE